MKLLKQYKVTICVPYGPRVEDLTALGCKFVDIQLDRRGLNPFKDIKLLFRYWVIFNNEKPDIVLTYTIKPNVYGGFISALKNIPYIVNITGLGAAFENRGIVKLIATLLYKISMRKCSCIFFQNIDTKNRLLPLLRHDTYHEIIPGSGVNTNDFEFSEYPDKRECIVFNYVGRIMKIKGIEEFLFCSKEIKREYPYVTFNVIGAIDDLQYEAIIRKYDKLKIINYLGQQSDMKSFIRDSNAVIHASHSEGMSNVLLEHCSMGRPCIAPNIPGCKEIVEHGINGFLFTVCDSQDMLKKIKDFINIDYSTMALMGLEARKKVEICFDRDIIIDAYLAAIDRALTSD